MAAEEQLRRLINKWTADSDGSRAEARRLELSDHSRHATSISMLEARAQALDRCVSELETLEKSE